MTDVRDHTASIEAYIELIKLINTLTERPDENETIPELRLSASSRKELLEKIIEFPEPGITSLADEIMNRSYRPIDLLVKEGDELLIYSLISRGISVRKAKLSIDCSSPIRDIIRQACQCERNKERLAVPPHIQREIDTIRAPPPPPPQPEQQITNKRELSIESCKPMIPTRSNDQVNKRARLEAKIQSMKREQDLPKRELTPTSGTGLSKLVPPRLPDHGPPYTMKIGRIPKEASDLSIQTFLEVGADAFEVESELSSAEGGCNYSFLHFSPRIHRANKLEHRIDALGRNVHKYRPGGGGPVSTIVVKFPRLNLAEDLMITEEKIDGKFYKSAVVRYHSEQIARLALEEFHEKRYLPRDLARRTVICSFIS